MTDQDQTSNTEQPAPEWDEEVGEWGRWEPDPEDNTKEMWVPAETSDAPANAEAVLDDARPKQAKNLPMKKRGWNPEGLANRCVAHRKNGDRCKRAAIAGGSVCRVHGGASPAVKAAARVRLEMAADRLAERLLGMATQDDVPSYVRLEAIRDALDRAGVSAKTAIEVEVGPAKGFEQVFSGITGGTRADSRAARGIADGNAPNAIEDGHAAMMDQDRASRALAVPTDDYLDAEVVPAHPAAIDRTPARIDDGVTAEEFVREANAKAANTRPRHT